MYPAYKYDIQLPSHMDPEKKYPTIFTLHGKGSNEKNMFGLVAPVSDDFIIVSIRGNLILGAGYQYYELKSLGNPIREMFDQAIGQLEAFIHYATEKYPIDAAKRYLLGFSQGAILSMSLALTMGEQLKGIVALNGYVPDFVKTEYPLKSVNHISVFISHGEFDTVFPIRIGHETAAYFENLTSNLTFKTYPTDHGVSEENQQDFVNWLKKDADVHVEKE
ncbi:dienelactone hydrolase family protein [Paenibacillus alginolyticus]|uniref:Dienelactone hydrolase family protein n=1 Tax=Paenibacillus alginolyticus TaxID=59839 RepID=A0ABT4GA77_9BACL|nr:dienelactone hydrolase family protein [Paenibacillus alginolyticus]MCY9670058.1 dienelactone hydrolase family protein [Paenibacillus alginolyticus]MCY9693089.1 dienelactone hydrolase family protein [Paenibacillus alginolyticus]MEC0147176.1 dienelactone hydrolase family protein [Paenibacillus alginolyticus]